MMSVYLINKFEIINPELFGEYVVAVMPIIAAYQGEVIVGNNAPRVLEGTNPGMNVVIAFPSEAAAMGFVDSPEYQAVKKLRLSSTVNGVFIYSPGYAV